MEHEDFIEQSEYWEAVREQRDMKQRVREAENTERSNDIIYDEALQIAEFIKEVME